MRRLRAVILALIVMGLAAIPAQASTDVVVIDVRATTGSDNGIIWINTQVGYLVYSNNNDATPDIVWTKTIDGGQTWTIPITIDSACGTTNQHLSVWFDRWTKGLAGTKIHMAWVCGDDGDTTVHYNSLDVSNDSLGTQFDYDTVFTYFTACSPCSVSITETSNSYLFIHIALTSSANNSAFIRSVDGGANWTVRQKLYDGVLFDGMLAPAIANPWHGIQSDDVFAYTATGDIILYNDTIDIWGLEKSFNSETGSIGAVTRSFDPSVVTPQAGGEDGDNVPYVFWGLITPGSGSTPKTFYVVRQDVGANSDMSEPYSDAFELVTPVFTGTTDILDPNIGLTWDDNHSILYAFWVTNSSHEVNYKTSSDYGQTWSGTTRFDDDSDTKSRVFTSPVFTSGGARLMPVWLQFTARNLATNLGNASEISSEITTDDQDAENKLQRFVTGLGFTGSGGRFAFAFLGALMLSTVLIFKAPVIVFLSLEMFWWGLMALPGVEFITAGLFMTLLVIFGLLMIFAVLQKLMGDTTGGNLG